MTILLIGCGAIVGNTTGNVYYARTYGWSSTTIQNPNPVTTEFALPATLPAGTYSLVVVANGFASDPIAFTAPVPTPTFSLNVPAKNVTAIPGENTPTTVTITDLNGFSGPVSLSISGLPSGVTASFNPSSTTTNSVLTLTVPNTMLPGTTVVTVTGTSGSLTNTTKFNLVVPPSLIGYWNFDEGTGPTATDSSGFNNTGTLGNHPAWVAPGKVGAAALSFAASGNQAVNVNNASSLNPTNGITIADWINTIDWSGNRRILQKGNGDNQYMLLNNSGSLQFALSGVGALNTTLPPTGTWVHVAATWNGSTMIIYTNGVQRATLAAVGTIGTTTNPISIGGKYGSGTSGDYFNGKMDDVRLYNRALSGAEIVALIADFGLSTSPSNLTIGQGTNGTSVVTVNATNGFSGSVNLSASDLPTGVTASFNPSSTTTTNSVITLTASNTASLGTTNVIITGISGSLTHTTTITLTINQPVFPPVVLTVGPQTSGQFKFSFSGVDGDDYVTETSTNLIDWSSVSTNMPSGGMVTFTNTNPTDPQRFYRVRR